MQVHTHISVKDKVAYLWSSPEHGIEELFEALDRARSARQIGAFESVFVSGACAYGETTASSMRDFLSTWAKKHACSVLVQFFGGYKAEASQSSIYLDGMLEIDETGKLVESEGFIFDEIEELAHMATLALREHIKQSGFARVHLGLSGGLDSALVATLAVDALGKENVVGILMPSAYSSQGSLDDALELAKTLGIKTHTIEIEPLLKSFQTSLSPVTRTDGLVEENLQARIRGILLMAYSNAEGSILLSTGNKSEVAVGYCTLYGDMAGGFAPIADIYKTKAYELARFLGRIPESTLTKAPSAELRPDQKDQDSLPDYPVLDGILHNFIEDGISPEDLMTIEEDEALIERVWGLLTRSAYKRVQATSFCKLSAKTIAEANL